MIGANMAFLKTCVALLVLSFGIAPAAHAHLMRMLTYDELFDRSDFIVIARPVTRSADTIERNTFLGIIGPDAGGRPHTVPAIGMETSFEVVKVLKGDSQIKKFVLHHYRDASASSILAVGGPLTVDFDPSDPKRRRDILLFLVKEADGRYAPYGGQTDPGGRSIYALDDPP